VNRVTPDHKERTVIRAKMVDPVGLVEMPKRRRNTCPFHRNAIAPVSQAGEDQQARKDPTVPREKMANLAATVFPAVKDHPVQLVHLVRTEVLAPLVAREKMVNCLPERRDHLVHPARTAARDPAGHQAKLANPEKTVVQDPTHPPASPEAQAALAKLEPKVEKENPARTAHLEVASTAHRHVWHQGISDFYHHDHRWRIKSQFTSQKQLLLGRSSDRTHFYSPIYSILTAFSAWFGFLQTVKS